MDIPPPPRGRGRTIRLGKDGEADVFAAGDENICVVGQPRSGKTTRIFTPAVSAYPGPVVATVIRSERDPSESLHVRTMADRLQMAHQFGGRVLSLSFGDIDPGGATRVRWDMTMGCDDFRTAMRRGSALAGAAVDQDAKDRDYWVGVTSSLLVPLLYYFATDHVDGPADVALAETMLSWPAVDESVASIDSIADALRDTSVSDDRSALARADARKAHLMLSQYTGDVTPAVRDAFSICKGRIFNHYLAAPNSALLPSLDLQDFANSNGTLYILVGRDDSRSVGPVVAALLDALSSVWRQRQRQLGHLLLALDEVATVAPIDDLPGLAATCAGDGIQLLLGFQSFSMATDRWGREQAEAVLFTNCQRFIAMAGLDDEVVTARLVRLAGVERQPFDVRVTTDGGRKAPFATDERLRSEAQLIAKECGLPKEEVYSQVYISVAARVCGDRLLASRQAAGIYTPRYHDRYSGGKHSGRRDVTWDILRRVRFERDTVVEQPRLTPQVILTAQRGQAFLRDTAGVRRLTLL